MGLLEDGDLLAKAGTRAIRKFISAKFEVGGPKV